MFEGGPTTARRNLRQATSSWWRSFWWTVRCIHRFALNARKAAWRWRSMSASWQPPAWSKHPSHLCVETRSKTSTVTPPCVCNCGGGWAWVVKIFVFFSRFNVKPTCASEATSSSNKRHVLSNVVQNKSMSSANRKSNKGLRPSSRDNPSASIFARHEDKAISSTELNKRGLSTHPWRTPPRTLNPQGATNQEQIGRTYPPILKKAI